MDVSTYKFTGLIATTLFLLGCETLQKPTSSYSLQRLTAPEVAAQPWRASAHIGHAEMHKVVLPDSATSRPNFNCQDTPLCVVEGASFFSGNLTVLPGFAFAYNSQLNRVSATWQFAGDYADHAKPGNFSQALVLGASKHSDSDSAVELPSTQFTGRTAAGSWDQTTQAMDFGWIGGYRIHPDWLIYGGPFVTFHDIDNRVSTETRAEVVNITNQFNFSARQLGANLAVQYQAFTLFDIPIELHLEFVAARYRMNNGSIQDSQLNFMVGSRF